MNNMKYIKIQVEDCHVFYSEGGLTKDACYPHVSWLSKQ